MKFPQEPRLVNRQDLHEVIEQLLTEHENPHQPDKTRRIELRFRHYLKKFYHKAR